MVKVLFKYFKASCNLKLHFFESKWPTVKSYSGSYVTCVAVAEHIIYDFLREFQGRENSTTTTHSFALFHK